MVYDIYEGLSEEYKEYRVIQPQQLNFRPAANDLERGTSSGISNDNSQDAKTLTIVGIVMIVLGVLIAIKALGGIVLALFGIVLIALGKMKNKQNNSSALVATGTLIKKDIYNTGTTHGHTHHTFRWLVIVVDGMEKTLCAVHARPDDFDEVREGDRILVQNNGATINGKRLPS